MDAKGDGAIVDTSPRLETGMTENETKAILIKQVLDLQNTLDVKHDNTKLHADNQLLTQYIETLQSAPARGGGNGRK